MKRFLIFIILLSVLFSLFSSEEVIALKNSTTKKSGEIRRDIFEPRSNDYFLSIPLLPKSIYIGDLGDFQSIDINRNELLSFINEFFVNLKSNKESVYINHNFLFIYKNVYTDMFTGNGRQLVSWNLGYPHLEDIHAEVRIELYFRDLLLTGSIYLEKDNRWTITDLQLEEQEKKILDPSSPFDQSILIPR